MEKEIAVRTFRPKDLQATAFSLFRDMRENEEICDVSITTKKGNLKAHCLVLSTIPYFRSVFRMETKECAIREITILDVDPEPLETLIDFAYTSEVTITVTNVTSLLVTSKYLEINSVLDACLQFLYDLRNPQNAFKIHAWAKYANSPLMVEEVDSYIRENFDEVSKSGEFLKITVSTLKNIICRNDLNVVGEDVVFKSVIRWIKVSASERIHFLPELLSHVRLALLDPNYLSVISCEEELIKNYPFCLAKVKAARNFQLYGSRGSSSWNFSIQQRYHKNTHHLKCSKELGYGIYAICNSGDFNVSLNYYDHLNKRWTSMYNFDQIFLVYVLCIKENIYFIGKTFIHALNLKKMHSFKVAIAGDITPAFAGVSVHMNKMYFFGCDNSNLVQCFCPQDMTFLSMGRMKQKRLLPGTATLEDSIYITGGENREYETLCTAERYDPCTGQCEEISPMLTRRQNHNCTSLNGKIYTCGGLSIVGTERRCIQTCEVYYPMVDQWTFIRRMNSVKPAISLYALNNKLYVIDVESAEENHFKVQTYDPKDNKWTSEDPVTFEGGCSTVRIFLTNSAIKL